MPKKLTKETDRWTYHLYKAKNQKNKFFIQTPSGRKIYFGAHGMSDFTIHKDEKRKERYINRHQKRENWNHSGINTRGFWSRWILWNKPSLKASIQDTQRRFGIKITSHN